MACLKDRILLDGSSQPDRLPPALEDGFVRVDDLSLEEYVRYLRELAASLVYYNLINLPEGNWQPFLPASFSEFLRQAKSQPHIALLQVFLQTYLATVQRDLNRIPKKHLDYFYRNRLGFRPREAQPDRVYLFFELNNSTTQVLLPSGLEITGDDPVSGRTVLYRTESEVVLNQAKVTRYQSLFLDAAKGQVFSAAVANSLDGSGKPFSPGSQFWPVFGESQNGRSEGERTMSDASVGFAFGSSLLLLQEGTRTIDLTLHFNQDVPFSKTRLQAWTSGPNGWQGPYNPTVSVVNNEIHVRVVLSPVAPPVLPFVSDNLPSGFHADQPYLFIQIDPSLQQDAYSAVFIYQQAGLQVTDYSMSVQVNGMRNGVVVDNGSNIVPNKPFQPFGPVPARNTAFRVLCPEAASKSLDRLSILFNWLNLPFDFPAYYSGYEIDDDSKMKESQFKIELVGKLSGSWRKRPDTLLFARTNIAGEIEFYDYVMDASTAGPQLPDFVPTSDSEIAEGRLKAENPVFQAFGHQEFPQVLTRQILKLKDDPDTVIPRQPYTPTVKTFSLGYQASAARGADLKFYQVHPFGAVLKEGSGFSLLPEFTGTGCLFLGLQDLVPGQVLNLLLIFPETANVETRDDAPPFQIQWQFLEGNAWRDLNAQQVLLDSTDSWQQPGMISLQIPFTADTEHTVAERGLYWIRACLLSENKGNKKLAEAHAQAASAVFDAQAAADTGWNGAIGSGVLQQFNSPVAGIARMVQPLPSFGGAPAEKDEDLYARVNERIRHKKRAVQYWDYERLVLGAFPNIFKTKCLFHTRGDQTATPGSVTMILIPYVRQGRLEERLEPQPNPLLRRRVRDFIASLCSAWVDVNVVGPVYEQILLDFKVRFLPGYDPSFYLDRLREDIYRFLAPWAFAEGVDIVFENRIHRSAVIYYIEKLPYVDFVTDLKMYHAYDGPSLFGIGCMEIEEDFIIWEAPVPALGDMILEKDFVVGFESELAIATTARSILVSALNHRIEVLNSDLQACSGNPLTGIGIMAIERDFIIGTPC